MTAMSTHNSPGQFGERCRVREEQLHLKKQIQTTKENGSTLHHKSALCHTCKKLICKALHTATHHVNERPQTNQPNGSHTHTCSHDTKTEKMTVTVAVILAVHVYVHVHVIINHFTGLIKDVHRINVHMNNRVFLCHKIIPGSFTGCKTGANMMFVVPVSYNTIIPLTYHS